MRTSTRLSTRLINDLSKNIENLQASVAPRFPPALEFEALRQRQGSHEQSFAEMVEGTSNQEVLVMPMGSELSEACQMFLIPVTILFAALAAAPTEPLKTLLSSMGLLTSALWLFRIAAWTDLKWLDYGVVLALAAIFVIGWIISAIVHARLWAKQPKQSLSN